VHPTPPDLSDEKTPDHQSHFDLINKVTVLLYHLIFYLIGYSGSYSDYGTHGYPNRAYPNLTGGVPTGGERDRREDSGLLS